MKISRKCLATFLVLTISEPAILARERVINISTDRSRRDAGMVMAITEDLIRLLSPNRGKFVRQEAPISRSRADFVMVFRRSGLLGRTARVEVRIIDLTTVGSSIVVWVSYAGGPLDGATLEYTLNRQRGSWIIVRRKAIGFS